MDEVVLRVERYQPERDASPRLQTYRAPYRQGMMVLDALNHIRDEIDPTLAFRWSCRMGICGSCGMMVNGRPKLTCEDPVQAYGDKPITIGSLDYFPVIRDLVADISAFFGDKLPALQPWLIRQKEQDPRGEYLQTPEELHRYAAHSACINCMLCYAACPVFGLAPEFTGPAAIALAHRYNLDSRDEGAGERSPYLSRPDAVWKCTFVGECSVACPKGVMPAEAIQREKLRLAARWLLTPFLGRPT